MIKTIYPDDRESNSIYYRSIGALIQAQVSKMDFDFTKYANLRIVKYMDWKAEMSGLREQSGREKPLREQQWAKE